MIQQQFQIRSQSVVEYTEFPRSENYSRSFSQQRSLENLIKKKYLVTCGDRRTTIEAENMTLAREAARNWQKDNDLYGPYTIEQINKTYTGVLTKGARKRLNKAMEHLIMTAKEKRHSFVNKSGKHRTVKYKLIFITLTVHSPDRMITGKEGTEILLEPFLKWLRYNCGAELKYLWKAELQQRGQLHYHITSDKFIDKTLLQNKWNELQARAGYLDAYYKKHGHYNAPGTKVNAVYKPRDMAQYLGKCIYKEYDIRGEMAKDNEDKLSIEGKVWDCSINLKNHKYFKTDGATGTRDYINYAVKTGEAKITFADENCTFYRFKRPVVFYLSRHDKMLLEDHIQAINSYERKKPVKTIKISEEEQQEINDILDELYSKREPKPVNVNLKPEPPPKPVKFIPQPDIFSSS